MVELPWQCAFRCLCILEKVWLSGQTILEKVYS